MLLTRDLREFIESLNSRNVRYVIVGGWAYNFHAPPRATGDFDFFVAADEENEPALRSALEDFGYGSVIPGKKLFKKPIIMLGRAPNRIDIIAKVDGLDFEEAWRGSIKTRIDGIPVRILSRELLIKNKIASGRDKDLADVKVLRKMGRVKNQRSSRGR